MEPSENNSKDCDLRTLIQELIDKNISLDQAASILWELKNYRDAKIAVQYANVHGSDADTFCFLGQQAERHRLQMEHYLVVAGISQPLIEKLVRNGK